MTVAFAAGLVKCLSKYCRVPGMDTPEGSPVLRIGELSRRLGVSDHVLRAWESRYGLLQPVRSAGGFRLYSEADAHALHVRLCNEACLIGQAPARDSYLALDRAFQPAASWRTAPLDFLETYYREVTVPH